MTTSVKRKIFIAAGGTGGHIFPGVAIAENFLKRDQNISIFFVGTKRGLESALLPSRGWNVFFLPSLSLKDRRGLKKLVALLFLFIALTRAFILILKEKPMLIVSVGGYAAGPVTLAAALLRIPTVLLEPNAIPGFTSRLLCHVVRLICLGLPEAGRFFSPKKVIVTGTPVRREIHDVSLQHDFGTKPFFTIFCFGGSQGARRLNQALMEALPELSRMPSKIRLIHQIGKSENKDQIKKAYEKFGIEATVVEFLHDMKTAYEAADLVIARAGAMTIAELMVVARPSILVPYPYAADDHQRANAESLVHLGGAIMIADQELTGDRLAHAIKKMVEHPSELREMSEALVKYRHLKSAEKIVDESLKLIAA